MKFPVSVMVLLIVITSLSLIALNSGIAYDALEPHNYISPEEGAIKVTTKLYFVYDKALRTEYRTLTISDENYGKAVIENLSYGADNKFFKTIYDLGIKVNSVDLIDQTCFVNFEGSERLTMLFASEDASLYLWSIVNSLTELSQIKNVQFLVDGRQLTRNLIGYSLNQPLPMIEMLVYSKQQTSADIVIDFLENLYNRRFDLAYNLLSKASMNNYSYSAFIAYAESFLSEHKDFNRDTFYTRVYNTYEEVFVKFTKRFQSDGFMLNAYDKWIVIKEEEVYRINLTNAYQD